MGSQGGRRRPLSSGGGCAGSQGDRRQCGGRERDHSAYARVGSQGREAGRVNRCPVGGGRGGWSSLS